MAKIKLKVSKEAVEEAAEGGGDFEQAPPGIYILKLANLAPGFSKTDGKEDKSKPYVEAQWQIIGVGRDNEKPDKNFGRLWDYVSFSEDSEWKRAEYCNALGKKVVRGEFDVETDPDKPGTDIGKIVMGRVKKDTDLDGNYRAKLAKIFPYDPEGAGDLSEQSEGDGGDPFATEEPDGAETEEDGNTYLTREQLEAMEPKDIKPLLEQFDLDPSSFKGKTAIADAITAILEAQGAGDDGDGSGDAEDEESPF